MTLFSVLAMAGGLAILGLLPLPKNKRAALSSQSAGAALFGIGIVGLIYALMPQVA